MMMLHNHGSNGARNKSVGARSLQWDGDEFGPTHGETKSCTYVASLIRMVYLFVCFGPMSFDPTRR